MPGMYLLMGFQLSGALGSDQRVMYMLVFAVLVELLVLTHELGHLLVGRMLGRDDGRIVWRAGGAVTRFAGDTSTISNLDHALIATYGPVIQFVLSGVLCWVAVGLGEGVTSPVLAAGTISIVLAVGQMLPVPRFDGWLIAKCGFRTLFGRGQEPYDVADSPVAPIIPLPAAVTLKSAA